MKMILAFLDQQASAPVSHRKVFFAARNEGRRNHSRHLQHGGFAILVFSLLVGLFPLASARAELRIEQAQRDYQARYHLLTGGYLQWPTCSKGQSPAPQFPKDGFYGDLTQDPDEAVVVIQDLVQKFYSNNVIYGSFVNVTNGFDGLSNVTAITTYTETDMQPVI